MPARPGVPGRACADWVIWIEAFRRGENRPADHLLALDEALGGYGELSLVDRLTEAFAARLDAWHAGLARRLREGTWPVETVLLDARRRLVPLARLAASPLLPAEVAAQLREALETLAAATQRELENAVPKGPGAREFMAQVRRTPVTVVGR